MYTGHPWVRWLPLWVPWQRIWKDMSGRFVTNASANVKNDLGFATVNKGFAWAETHGRSETEWKQQNVKSTHQNESRNLVKFNSEQCNRIFRRQIYTLLSSKFELNAIRSRTTTLVSVCIYICKLKYKKVGVLPYIYIYIYIVSSKFENIWIQYSTR